MNVNNPNSNSPFNSFDIERKRYFSSYKNPLLPSDYDDICDFFHKKNQEQGFIGKTWNKIKNILRFDTSEKNTAKVLEKFKQTNTEKTRRKAIDAVNKYAKSQNSSLVVSRNFISSTVAGFGVLLATKAGVFKLPKIAPRAVELKIGTGAIIGAISGFGLKKLDAKSANREYSKKEQTNDLVKGALQGGITTGIDIVAQALKISISKPLKFIISKIANTFAFFALSTVDASTSIATKKLLYLPRKFNENIKLNSDDYKIENTDKVEFYGNKSKK